MANQTSTLKVRHRCPLWVTISYFTTCLTMSALPMKAAIAEHHLRPLTAVVGPHSNNTPSDKRYAARDNGRYCCGCFSS